MQNIMELTEALFVGRGDQTFARGKGSTPHERDNMSERVVLALLVGALVAVAGCAPSEGPDSSGDVLAITHAHLYPVTASPIESGTLLVRDGKIVAIGADVSVPSGARTLDVHGQSVIPGIVESHSHMGFKQLNNPSTGRNNNELSMPINAQVRAIDGLNSNDAAFPLALAAGVTTMNITTGSRSPISGQAVVIKLRGGTVEEMFLAEGGMKFAIEADRESSHFPEAPDAIKELLASELRAAQAYLEARAAADASGSSPPPRDLGHEALGKLLSHEWVVGVHTWGEGESEMRHAIALKKEFGLDLYIHHAMSTYSLVDELVEAQIPISFGPILPTLGREDPRLMGPVHLAERGGVVAFHQDHPNGHQYFLRHSASLFVRKGMSEQNALAGLTLNPAKLFHLDERIGSLEPGKDADFVILNGPPLDFDSLVEQVFIDGEEVFNRSTGDNAFGQRVPKGW